MRPPALFVLFAAACATTGPSSPTVASFDAPTSQPLPRVETSPSLGENDFDSELNGDERRLLEFVDLEVVVTGTRVCEVPEPAESGVSPLRWNLPHEVSTLELRVTNTSSQTVYLSSNHQTLTRVDRGSGWKATRVVLLCTADFMTDELEPGATCAVPFKTDHWRFTEFVWPEEIDIDMLGFDPATWQAPLEASQPFSTRDRLQVGIHVRTSKEDPLRFAWSPAVSATLGSETLHHRINDWSPFYDRLDGQNDGRKQGR